MPYHLIIDIVVIVNLPEIPFIASIARYELNSNMCVRR